MSNTKVCKKTPDRINPPEIRSFYDTHYSILYCNCYCNLF